MTAHHPALSRPPADLIAGAWAPIPGSSLQSRNPAHPDRVVWSGSAEPAHVDQAVDAARGAFPAWSAWPMPRRAEVLRIVQRICRDRIDAFAGLLCDEIGKPLWECKGEAALLANKIDITLDPQTAQNWGLARISGFELDLGATKKAASWFRPHGVMAVLGPFNFPMHLPNGHIVPALLAGNTIVFKPSDKAPACGQALAELFQQALHEAGAPDGVFNLVQGAAPIAAALAGHARIDGVLFTGSWPVGRRIMQANLDHPGRIIALELGGSNPAVVMPDADLRQAAIEIVRCAFNTTGQRCTSTRRAIIHRAVADRLIPAIVKAAQAISTGEPRRDPPVFMGPVISAQAKQAALEFENRLAEHGGDVLLAMHAPDDDGGHYLTPSIVRVPRFSAAPAADGPGFDCGCDEELFGPLLRLAVVADLDDAIEQANATRYGLAASIFTKDPAAIDRFRREARAGCVNVNCGTAGASSKLPFGGLGLSGNHRPAGSFALDYCAYPTAGMTELGADAAIAPGMAFDDHWL